MSIKKLFLKLSLLLTAIIVVAYAVHKTTTEAEPSFQKTRKIASTGKRGYLPLGKANRAMDIQIEEVPVSGFNGTRLAATVTVHRDIENSIQMNWELPEGVQLLNGDTEYWIHSLVPGQTHYSEIDVTGFFDEAAKEQAMKNIKLTGSVQMEGVLVAADAIFSTHVTQRDLSIRQRAPASMHGILNRKMASADHYQEKAAASEMNEKQDDPSVLRKKPKVSGATGEGLQQELPRIHF